MQLTHQNNIGFSIDAANQIYRTVVWEVLPDGEHFNQWDSFREEVENWVGRIGDPLKVPTPDSRSYTLDADWVVTSIKADAAQMRNLYTVTYSARKKNLDALMSGYSSQTGNNLEQEISASFVINDETLQSWLPQVGDVILWAGENFYCNQISTTQKPEGEWDVRLRIRNMNTLMLGLPGEQKTGELECTRTARWQVAGERIAEFLAANNIGGAADWAGSDYVIASRNCSAVGVYGYHVSLTAIHSGMRLIDIRKSDRLRHISFGSGEIVRDISYTGRWRVREQDLENFCPPAGSDASSWSENGFVVASVERRRTHPGVWEVTMLAQEPSYLYPRYTDIPENFDGDTESNLEMTYRKFSAVECGWLESGGAYTEYPNWNHSTQCPLVAESPLPANFIETPLECLTVTLVSYESGEPHTNASKLKNWLNGDLVYNGNLQGRSSLNGSWRKVHQSVDRYIYRGEVWTRIVRKWENAPRNYAWNPQFFNN
jgi:hypothetical protein